jgi:hypothetical protein
MKKTLFSLTALFLLSVSSLLLLILNRQTVQASTPTIAIVGGTVLAHQPSHITLQTVPEARIGMRVFYWCSNPHEMVRTVYANHNANVLGRSTWGWSTGAPCTTGNAVVIVNRRTTTGQFFVTQKTFRIMMMSSPKATPTITPTHRAPSPTPTDMSSPPPTAPLGDVNGNPWGYTLVPGSTPVTRPVSIFCNGVYFSCVATFWTDTQGYVAQCWDGLYTHSGGISDACSQDGGVEYPLYAHAVPLAKTEPTSLPPTPTP